MKKDSENIFHKLMYRETTIAMFEITGFLYHFFKDRERINIDLLIVILKRELPKYEGLVDYCLHYLLVNGRLVFISKRSVYCYDLDHFNFLRFYNHEAFECVVSPVYDKLVELKFKFNFTDLVILAFVSFKIKDCSDFPKFYRYVYDNCCYIAWVCLIEKNKVIDFIERISKVIYGKKISPFILEEII